MKISNIKITKEQIENSTLNFSFIGLPSEYLAISKNPNFGDVYPRKEGNKWIVSFTVSPKPGSCLCERVELDQQFARRIDAARAGAIARGPYPYDRSPHL